MQAIINVVLPVFALVGLGFFAVRAKWFPDAGVHGLIAFVNNFAAPCLLFRAMLEVDFGSAFNPRLISGFYLSVFSVFALGIILARTWFKKRPGEAVAVGFNAAYTNTVLLGIPIIQRAYGDEAMPLVYTIIGLHAPVLITSGMLVMELARRDGENIGYAALKAGKRIVTNPLLIGIGLGLVGNIFGITLNEPADAFTKMMTAAVLPVALFGLGGALNSYRLRDNLGAASVMSFLGIFAQPALAYLILVPLLGVAPEIARYGVVLAAMPTGINAYVFATTYNRAVDISANTILISTTVSIFSVSFWLYFMSI